MQKKVFNFEFVDLGLSVKWATMNVGAKSVEDYGNYYSWRDVINVSELDWNEFLRKELETEVDLGLGCRMPLDEELNELIENCNWEWVIENGVSGYKIKSKVSENEIFMPAAGIISGEKLYYDGDCGYYISSSMSKEKPNGAVELIFRKGYKDKYIAGPYCKRSIRLVKK
jgi:hypothetical protein